ncbi:MAG: D-alanyl-D-alanine carboxypeptidase/D-alanyl-D-alanine-endopeptidase [Pseudomonadota bacterium]
MSTQSIEAAAERLIAKAGFSGDLSYAVIDTANGERIAGRNAKTPMPPASTAKAITAAYALEYLGSDYRFTTSVMGTGALRDGRLEGDLVLAGGGDPLFDTSDMGGLIQKLRTLGLSEVTGRFLIWDAALPYVEEIVPSQPDHLGYNPAVSGLNLNFNRVYFQWRKQGGGYVLTMDARDGDLIPQVALATMSLSDRRAPVFQVSLDRSKGREHWSVAQSALGASGSRWLPVRNTKGYAAEVFSTLAAQAGIALPAPVYVRNIPNGAVPLASHLSAPMDTIVRSMLRYSTNITAEVVGLTASKARSSRMPTGLENSAHQMNQWAKGIGMGGTQFVDHSGLSDASRVTAQDMAQALARLGHNGPLRPLLRQITLKTKSGAPEPFGLQAKTGTLNFVSALTGHIERPGKSPLVFAVMTADLNRRNAIPKGQEDRPPGATGWARRSRSLQWDLVRLWAKSA